MYHWAPTSLAVFFIHTWLAATFAEGGVIHRNLLLFGSGDNDDDAGGSTSFDFRFEDNVTLSQDSIEPFCFKHHVDCVRYTSRAIEAETGKSAKILVFVAPKRLARKLQEERQINGDDVVDGSACVDGFCDRSDGIDTQPDEDMCVVLVNANFEFTNTSDIDDFSQSTDGLIFVTLMIKGCPTTSQRIVAIVVPIAVFLGVTACFSAWWVRRRRKEHMGTISSPSSELAAVAYPPARQQVLPMGQPYTHSGQAYTHSGQLDYMTTAPGVMAGSMPGTYQQTQYPRQDKYPIAFANV